MIKVIGEVGNADSHVSFEIFKNAIERFMRGNSSKIEEIMYCSACALGSSSRKDIAKFLCSSELSIDSVKAVYEDYSDFIKYPFLSESDNYIKWCIDEDNFEVLKFIFESTTGAEDRIRIKDKELCTCPDEAISNSLFIQALKKFGKDSEFVVYLKNEMNISLGVISLADIFNNFNPIMVNYLADNGGIIEMTQDQEDLIRYLYMCRSSKYIKII